MDYFTLFIISVLLFVLLLLIGIYRFLRARHPCRGLLGIGTGNPYLIQERKSQGPGWKMYALGRYHANRIVLRRNALPSSTHFKTVVISCTNDIYSTRATIEVDATLNSGTRWKNKLETGMLLNLDDGSWLYKDPFQPKGPGKATRPKRIYVDLTVWEMILWSIAVLLLLVSMFYFWYYS